MSTLYTLNPLFDNCNDMIDEFVVLQPKYADEYLKFIRYRLVEHTKIQDGLNPILIDCMLWYAY